ncbi:MAG: PolC-type DNA polymerase III [Lachnospiraceae bacterium]|nr:PolC-type DNA polymerase III [Lachnospiraceae bacterium]
MKFFDAFKTLQVEEPLKSVFQGVEVVAVSLVKSGNFLRVKISPNQMITTENFRKMENELACQVLNNIMSCRIEYENGYEYAEAGSGVYVAAPEKKEASQPAPQPKAPTKAPSSYAPGGGGVAKRKYAPSKKNEPDPDMLYGKSFDGVATEISDIITDMRDVIIRGQIFENEMTVTKNGFKILKLSVTDRKDSISIKIFIKDGEEELPGKLKKGLVIEARGKVEYDNFEGEILMTRVSGIRVSKEPLSSRMDNAPKKRVELHLHTQYSDMDALTPINDLIDTAIKWGHKSVAITDHGVVQGFTDAFHKLQDMRDTDFKVIYGVEGYLVDDLDDPIVQDPDSEEDIELRRWSAIPDEVPKIPDPAEEERIEKVKKGKYYHVIILAANETGRRNLYRLVSYAHINYFSRRPRIPKSVLNKYREGLILGSACVMGELYDAILSKEPEARIEELVNYYDYLEIQPVANNEFLVRNYQKNNDPEYRSKHKEIKGHMLKDASEIQKINRQIYELGKKHGKLVVATGDVHFLNPEDEIYRHIILDSQKYADADDPGPFYLRTTEEMLAEFAYLGDEIANEIVIENTNIIADMIEKIEPVRPDKCPPVIENSDENLRNICYETAHSMYGPELPEIVVERLEKELTSIISNGYSVMYIIARELVQKSVSDGYLVGSRGSVGSSLAATMSGITEVNPLKPHYRCPHCFYSEFDSEEVNAYAGGAGCDMPDKDCPVCGTPLIKDGFDIPFETFLGFKGDKEPDIDLNFSGEYQANAHDYTEVIFGRGHTFKAGTISKLQDKTVYGYVKHYFEDHNKSLKKCEMNRIIAACTGVKRSTGQHPGGIVVLPHGEEIYSFTPVQFPANDAEKNIVTTHFEYHSIDHNLLKLDILGHDDPTMIRMLEDLTGFDAKSIKLDNPEVMKLFEGTEVLGITPDDIQHPLGTLGVPEFGTDFVMQMLVDTKPKNYSDLVRIAGLSHGTDVWLGNAEKLIKEEKATLSTCICTRDDIMLYLIGMGVEPAMSFDIMENVRKGKVAAGKAKKWPEWEAAMKAQNVPDWYLWSCTKIQYMFPKAHAVAYVMMAYRIAYFKIFYPLEYYAAFFSIRASSFDYEKMCQGLDHLREEMALIKGRIEQGTDTPKDNDLLKYMYNVEEMYARGFDFMPIDIYKAGASKFRIYDGKLMPSFQAIDGMGEKAAVALEEEAAKGKFTSREELKSRTKLSGTMTDKLYSLGLLGNMPESSQLSIMDFLK